MADMMTEKARLIAERYEEAYYQANGKPVTVRCASPGWYCILRDDEIIRPATKRSAGTKRHRISEIEEWTKGLEDRAAENKKAAERTGFIVKIAPPRLESYKHMTERYYVGDGNWTPFRDCPTVFVFKGAHEADSIAREVNEGLPFKYAEFEPF